MRAVSTETEVHFLSGESLVFPELTPVDYDFGETTLRTVVTSLDLKRIILVSVNCHQVGFCPATSGTVSGSALNVRPYTFFPVQVNLVSISRLRLSTQQPECTGVLLSFTRAYNYILRRVRLCNVGMRSTDVGYLERGFKKSGLASTTLEVFKPTLYPNGPPGI